jgi:hypothetical protein
LIYSITSIACLVIAVISLPPRECSRRNSCSFMSVHDRNICSESLLTARSDHDIYAVNSAVTLREFSDFHHSQVGRRIPQAWRPGAHVSRIRVGALADRAKGNNGSLGCQPWRPRSEIFNAPLYFERRSLPLECTLCLECLSEDLPHGRLKGDNERVRILAY